MPWKRSGSWTAGAEVGCWSPVGTLVFVFFSSRRRHTRCSRDWSSDVCSSDLSSNGGRSCSNSLLHIHFGRVKDSINSRATHFHQLRTSWEGSLSDAVRNGVAKTNAFSHVQSKEAKASMRQSLFVTKHRESFTHRNDTSRQAIGFPQHGRDLLIKPVNLFKS